MTATQANDRPDVVLLHGWGTNRDVWREVGKRLAARFDVHAPVLPYSDAAISEDFSTVEDIAARIADRAPRRCMVCGWSLGGAVALAWALQAPEQVTRLALIATSPSFVRRADWPHALEARAVTNFAHSVVREPDAVLTRYIALQARGDVRAMRVARHLRQTLSRRSRPGGGALQRGLMLLKTDLRGVLARIVQPALVIHGARDTVVPLTAAEYLTQALPDARISVIAGAAHAPFISSPAEVSETLASFFDGR